MDKVLWESLDVLCSGTLVKSRLEIYPLTGRSIVVVRVVWDHLVPVRFRAPRHI